MRTAGTAPSTLLLPLIPALAMALAAIVPTSHSVAHLEEAHHAPPAVAPTPPPVAPTPCTECTTMSF